MRRLHWEGPMLAVAGWLIAGCGTSSGPAAAGDPGTSIASAELCADCQPCAACLAASGGETTDFGGGSDPCLSFVSYPDDGEADDARIRALLPQIEGTFEAPLEWQVRAGTATGFVTHTRMKVTSRVDRAWYAISTIVPQNCTPPRIALDLTLSVETEDGALSGGFKRFLLTEEPFLHVNDLGRTWLALDAFSGSLELELDAARAKEGSLSLRVSLIPGYGLIAGQLVARVKYLDGAEEMAVELQADWPPRFTELTNAPRPPLPYPQLVQELAREANLTPL